MRYSRVRIRKRLAILFAAVTLAISAFYMIVSSPPPPAATGLIMLFPPTMHPHVAAEITVAAVDDYMQIDPSRDDLIRISLNPGSRARLGLAETPQSEWAQNLTVRLVNGKASFMMMGERLEMVVMCAEWIDGRSPLRPLTTMRGIGVD